MNDKYPYDYNPYKGDYLTHENQELKTSQNLETIEKLFEEWDDEDKSTSDDFSLDSQSFDNSSLNYEPKYENTNSNKSTSSNSSSYDEPSNSKYDLDPMEQTREIDSVDLAELKALQAELHKLYDEQQPQLDEGASQSQSKGKTLTKATKQGIAFSNGSLTKTFLDCVVLCFVTASMGFAFILNIINHI